MTFKQAYTIAMERSERFRRHDAKVKAAQGGNEKTACCVFTVEAGQTFYYGYDGTEIVKGRHSARRSQVLIDRGEALIIL